MAASIRHIDRYLSVFGHTKIQYQGRDALPQEYESILKAPPPPSPAGLPHLYNPRWQYGQEGAQNRTFYDWTEWTPFRTTFPQDQYTLEICCLCADHFRLFGDHSWIRIITPEGKIYSAGLYREDNFVSTGCEWKKGRIQSPDISEFWKEPIHTRSFPIEESGFQAIKKRLEEDHQKSDLHFHVIGRNCTAYTMELASLANVSFPTKISFLHNFIPLKLQEWGKSLHPQPLKRLADWSWSWIKTGLCILLNCAQLALGSMRISKTFTPEEASRFRPHLRSYLDLLNPRKADFDAPFRLRFAESYA